MTDRAGRNTAAREGLANDPRARRNSQQRLTENELNPSQLTLGRKTRTQDNTGRITIMALQGLQPLPSTATTAQMAERLNEIVRRLSG